MCVAQLARGLAEIRGDRDAQDRCVAVGPRRKAGQEVQQPGERGSKPTR
jgi:hypothetical protein